MLMDECSHISEMKSRTQKVTFHKCINTAREKCFLIEYGLLRRKEVDL